MKICKYWSYKIGEGHILSKLLYLHTCKFRLYGVPELLSGTASLVLKQTELDSIDAHYKKKLQSLMKLYDKTPESVIYFLSGSLPASATLHIRQLTLFSMIARLPNNILHQIAKYLLTTSKDLSKSWFTHILSNCLKTHSQCMPSKIG